MIRPRIDLEHCSPAVHGGAPLSRVRLDFSTNVSAWGSPPAVRRALLRVDSAAYPDPEARAARNAAARCWKLPSRNIMLMPGAAEAIHRVARAFLTAGDVAVVAAPAFAEYARAVHAAGGRCVEVRHPQRLADATLAQVKEAAHACRARLVFVASPTSPLGTLHPRRELLRLLEGSRFMLVLDESYRSFAFGRFTRPTLAADKRVIHIRSITKDFALAGVRAALVVAQERPLAAVNAAGPPWATSTVAQKAAVAALRSDSRAWLEKTLRASRAARAELVAALRALTVIVHPTSANYVSFTTSQAGRLHRELLKRGIAVRDCASFGLPNTLRVAVRKPSENRRLIHELRRLL